MQARVLFAEMEARRVKIIFRSLQVYLELLTAFQLFTEKLNMLPALPRNPPKRINLRYNMLLKRCTSWDIPTSQARPLFPSPPGCTGQFSTSLRQIPEFWFPQKWRAAEDQTYKAPGQPETSLPRDTLGLLKRCRSC